MRTEKLQDTIDSLDDLLDQERAALLEGDLDLVARLHTLKESLIDDLNKLDVQDTLDLELLNTKVKRNQELLNSALDGIRSVARRLAAIRRVRQSLDTYDSTGKKKVVDIGVDRSVEKRA